MRAKTLRKSPTNSKVNIKMWIAPWTTNWLQAKIIKKCDSPFGLRSEHCWTPSGSSSSSCNASFWINLCVLTRFHNKNSKRKTSRQFSTWKYFVFWPRTYLSNCYSRLGYSLVCSNTSWERTLPSWWFRVLVRGWDNPYTAWPRFPFPTHRFPCHRCQHLLIGMAIQGVVSYRNLGWTWNGNIRS